MQFYPSFPRRRESSRNHCRLINGAFSHLNYNSPSLDSLLRGNDVMSVRRRECNP